jgi:hypothetical protein
MESLRIEGRTVTALGAATRTAAFSEKTMAQSSPREGRGWSWWYLLLLIQFVAVLWPPFYNKLDPTFIGLPFFYWYQLLWIIIGGVLTAVVYFNTQE